MRKTRQWVRASGKISPAGGRDTHLGALAYMSDSYFVGTIPLVHLLKVDRSRNTPSQGPESSARRRTKSSQNPPLSRLAVVESAENKPPESSALDRPIGMMVSLNHSIYFHRPREVVADDWVLAENESPWSGEGRGLAIQKLWSRGGRLLATCVQEVGALLSSSDLAFPKTFESLYLDGARCLFVTFQCISLQDRLPIRTTSLTTIFPPGSHSIGAGSPYRHH